MHCLKYAFCILWLGLGSSLCQAAVSQQQYESILDLIEATYSPLFQAQNQRLQVTRYWDGDSLSATAWKHEDSKGEISVIQINGGIARHAEIDEAGFALIVCHAIGHHLAGPPLTWKFSVEGQADYFGASHCLRQILPKMENTYSPSHPAYGAAETRCNATVKDTTEQRLCARIMLAGLSVARFHAAKESQPMPKLSTLDPSMAEGILEEGPSPQCRLDTYAAAALCTPAMNEVRPAAERWLCTADSVSQAVRPKCWHNPKTGG